MILLDSAVFLYWVQGDSRLGRERAALVDRGGGVALSAASLLEIGDWIERGDIVPALPVLTWLDLVLARTESVILPVTPSIAARKARLPAGLGDPVDRAILATALEHDLELATLNPVLKGCAGVRYAF